MSKVKYLFRRIRKLNFDNLKQTLESVNKKTSRSKIILLADIIWCGFRYQAGHMDYNLFEMYNLKKADRDNILTVGKNNELVKILNNKTYFPLFNDKALFNQKFNKYLKRDWFVINNNYDDYLKFVKDKDIIIIKPLSMCCGKGVEKIDLRKADKKKLYDKLIFNKQLMLEEVAKQNKKISKIYSKAINTVRVVTILSENNILSIISVCFRIGVEPYVVDNFHSNGLCCPIDIKTGMIKRYAVNKKGERFTKHPDTKEKIVGFTIPHWHKVIKLISDASKVVPQMRYVGWDVCIGEDDVSLIEGNEFPSNDLTFPDCNMGTYEQIKEAIVKEK